MVAQIQRRIIPARAGFTATWSTDSGPQEDHPRSRGVYYEDMRTKLQVEGSSPLARGLPSLTATAVALAGIIPARAGFTPDARDGLVVGRDHPRSRGVYKEACCHLGADAGSSPLARGLRATQRILVHRHRIIPARAGFTCR